MISLQHKKIAIFRALQLGDMLCAIPAIRALKVAYPNAILILIGLPWAESLVSRFPQYFDSFMHFPGFPGLPEQVYELSKFQRFEADMKAAKFDIILQMQGNGTIVNDMLQKLNAGFVMGFTLNGSHLDSNAFMPYPNYGHEINRHLTLMEYFGISSLGTDLEFPIKASDEIEIQELQLPIENYKYVCIHPGSRGAWRQWPTGHFAALADLCAMAGLVVLVTGTSSEKGIVAEVIARMQCHAINLAGKTSLGAIGSLIGKSFLLISNCTGVSHMAAALKTPSIVISMDGEPERWGPLNTNLHHTMDWTRKPDFDEALCKTEEFLKNRTH